MSKKKDFSKCWRKAKLYVNREVENCTEAVKKQEMLWQQDYEEWKICRTQLPLSQFESRMKDLIKIEESLFSVSGSQSISTLLEEETYQHMICKIRSNLKLKNHLLNSLIKTQSWII
ncbi:uncharacterized protein [Primulina eburnea]|uniref:uncharacterized protein n=1 Tax=Primulina eburnea TaxID=1245227 RepID=UPI003C6C014F